MKSILQDQDESERKTDGSINEFVLPGAVGGAGSGGRLYHARTAQQGIGGKPGLIAGLANAYVCGLSAENRWLQTTV